MLREERREASGGVRRRHRQSGSGRSVDAIAVIRHWSPCFSYTLSQAKRVRSASAEPFSARVVRCTRFSTMT
jgi:hypothetical protein